MWPEELNKIHASTRQLDPIDLERLLQAGSHLVCDREADLEVEFSTAKLPPNKLFRSSLASETGHFLVMSRSHWFIFAI